ncbi:MAG: N-acyl-D-amino-acid deacylase family protein [Gemmatimonadaceae bacterium]
MRLRPVTPWMVSSTTGRPVLTLTLLPLLLAAPITAQTPTYDVVLRGGTLLDGRGGPPRRADVGIRGDRIVRVGSLGNARGTVDLDVSGKMVAPGFINVHSHADPRALSSAVNLLTQGVTTVLLNADGGGPTDLDEQLTTAASRGLALNIAASVPFNSIWASVMGMRDVRPSDEQVARMQALLVAGLEGGGFGVSAGLDYKPAYYATVSEVQRILAVVKPWNTFFTNHDRILPTTGYSSVAGMQETMAIGFETGMVPVFTHMKLQGREQGGARRMLDTMHGETRRGRWVAADVYPYLSGQTMLAALIVPGWAQEGGVTAMRERLRDPALRQRIIAEANDAIAARFTGAAGILLNDDGTTLLQVMERQQLPTPGDAVAHVLESRMPSAILGFGAESDLVQLLADPDIAIACDCDAALPATVSHPRYFGTFPRVLGRYVREQRVMTWAAAIRKMTMLPASLMGLPDRGRLAEGVLADVVVFDSSTVMDHATFQQPTVLSTGIVHVLVNGAVALRDGAPTGGQAGRALRRTRDMISRRP